jgi:hypothetical protein
MALVKFTPDDTAPPGTGWFTNDIGRTIYTTDLEGARGIPPAPSQPSSTDAEPPAPPGTTVSYAGDASSPYANAVASNEGATGSAAVGAPPGTTGAAHAAVARAAQVVPPASAPAAPAAAQSPAESAAAKAAAVIPPVVKDTTTKVLGRKAADVEKQIGSDRAALEGLTGATEQNAAATDTRALGAIDKRVETKQEQVARTKEDQAQYAADQRSADARVKQLMDLPDGQLDPDRFVNSLSTGSKIGLTVLAAISGFANGVRNAGGPNSQGGPPDLSVLNVLTRRIDEDIMAQKDQLAQGRLRKSNLIARAEAQGASAKQAEATARAQLWSLAADIGDLQAQRIGLDGAQLAAAKQQTAAMRYQSGVHEGDLRAQEETKIQTSHEVESGKAGPAGKGNPELQSKAWEAYDKAVNAGQDPTTAYRQSGLAELGVTQPTGAPKRSEGEAKASAVATATAPYASKLGLVEDPAHPGKFVAPKGKEDDSPADTIMGGRLFSGAARRKQTREVKESRLQLAHAIMQASGGGMKLEDAEELVNGSTLGEIAESLNTLNSQYGEHANAAERNTAPAGVGALGFAPVK